MHPSSPTQIGIIGCGNISNAYFNACNRFPFLHVKACSDLVAAAADAKAKEHNCKAVTIEALLADPEIVLVINLTTPQAHAELDLRIIAAGKHVYSEKPFALDRFEGAAVVAAANAKGLRVGCAPDTCLGAAIQTARALLDENAIGRVVGFSANMINGGHESWHPSPEFYYKKGGGPLFDMGPYYLHALITLLGPVVRVTGFNRTTNNKRTIASRPKRGTVINVEVPTHITSILEFACGAIGTLTTTFDVPGGHTMPQLELWGTHGSLQVPDPNGTGGPVRIRRIGDKDWVERFHTHPYREGSRGVGVADLIDALNNDRPHRANADVALHAVDIMQAIHEASDTGRAVTITTTCDQPQAMDASKQEWSEV